MGKRRIARKTPGKNAASVRGEIGKENFAPVYFFHGPDDLERDELVTDVINAALDPA